MFTIQATGHSMKYTAVVLYAWWSKQFLSFLPRVSSFITVALFVAGGIAAAPVQALAPGAVIGWGNNALGQTTIPTGLTGITGIAAGFAHNLALKRVVT